MGWEELGKGGMLAIFVSRSNFWSCLSVWEIHRDGPLYKQEAKFLPIVLGEEEGVTPISTQMQTAVKVLFNGANGCLFKGPLRNWGEIIFPERGMPSWEVTEDPIMETRKVRWPLWLPPLSHQVIHSFTHSCVSAAWLDFGNALVSCLLNFGEL